MADFFQTLIATIAVGSLYALLALGYTMVYGILKFINFAHSDIFVLGAWTAFTGATVALTRMGITAEQAPVWVPIMVLMLALLACCTTGYLVERFAYRPLRKAPRLNVLITAIGISLLLQNLGQISGMPVARDADGRVQATVPFGATPKSMPPLLPDAVLNRTVVASGTLSGGSKRGEVKLDRDIELIGDRTYRLEVMHPADASGDVRRELLAIAEDPGSYAAGTELTTQPRRNPADVEGASYRLVRSPLVPIRLIDVLIVGSSLLLMIGLQLLVFRTRMGAAMRAVSFSFDNAGLMGINVNRIVSVTFMIGTALAGAAAFLYPMKYPGLNQTAHGVWVLLGLKAFVAAVVGGIGDVRGAVLGGFLIAGIEFFGSRYISTELKDVYVFGLLILVLLVRPSGLLGAAVREKV